MKDIATNYFKRRNDNFHLIFEKINENLTNFEIPTKIERAPLCMATNEIKGAVYIGSVVITKSLTKFKPEEQEIVIQLAINKLLKRIGRQSSFPFGTKPAAIVNEMTSIVGHAPMEAINDSNCDVSIENGHFLAKSNEISFENSEPTSPDNVILRHSLKSISMAVRDPYEKSLVVYISNLDISEKKRNTGKNRRLFLFQMQDSVQSKKLFNLISNKFSAKSYPTPVGSVSTHMKPSDLN